MPISKTPVVLLWMIRLLTLAACGLCAYLWYASSQTEVSPIGCGWGAFDCEAVLGSPWAKWFGVPVAAVGLLCYSIAFIGSLLVGRGASIESVGWRMIEFIVPAALGAALWFLTVQFFAVGALCLYCFAAHACGMAVAVLVLLLRRSADQEAPPASAAALFSGESAAATSALPEGLSAPPQVGLPTVGGLVAVLLLAVGQILSDTGATVAVSAEDLPSDFQFNEVSAEPSAVTTEEPIEEELTEEATEEETKASPIHSRSKAPPRSRKKNASRVVELLDGRFKIDAYKYPIIGSPEAPHVLVEMMDYTCPHCREFHEKVVEATNLFEGEVAVIVMQVPSEILCNPFIKKSRPKNRGACKAAKLAIALFNTSPYRFEEFHHWMLQGERLPQYTRALLKAREMVDPDLLTRNLRDPEVEARIQTNVNLMGNFTRIQPRFGLPSQILKTQLSVGPPESLEQLLELWTKEYDLELPEAEEVDVEIPF